MTIIPQVCDMSERDGKLQSENLSNRIYNAMESSVGFLTLYHATKSLNQAEARQISRHLQCLISDCVWRLSVHLKFLILLF